MDNDYSDDPELVTCVGPIPPSLAAHLKSVRPPPLPEFSRLPRPGESEPITGASRGWLIDASKSLPLADRFLFRVRQRGKMRGAVFVNVGKLLAFLKKAEAAERATEEELLLRDGQARLASVSRLSQGLIDGMAGPPISVEDLEEWHRRNKDSAAVIPEIIVSKPVV